MKFYGMGQDFLGRTVVLYNSLNRARMLEYTRVLFLVGEPYLFANQR